MKVKKCSYLRPKSWFSIQLVKKIIFNFERSSSLQFIRTEYISRIILSYVLLVAIESMQIIISQNLDLNHSQIKSSAPFAIIITQIPFSIPIYQPYVPNANLCCHLTSLLSCPCHPLPSSSLLQPPSLTSHLLLADVLSLPSFLHHPSLA